MVLLCVFFFIYIFRSCKESGNFFVLFHLLDWLKMWRSVVCGNVNNGVTHIQWMDTRVYTHTLTACFTAILCVCVCVRRCGLACVYGVEYGGAANVSANHVAAAATFKKSNAYFLSLHMLHVWKTRKKNNWKCNSIICLCRQFAWFVFNECVRVCVCVASKFFSKLFRIPFMVSKFSANHPRCKWPVNFDADDVLSRLHLSRAPVNILDSCINWMANGALFELNAFGNWICWACVFERRKKWIFFPLDSIAFHLNGWCNAMAFTSIPFELDNWPEFNLR